MPTEIPLKPTKSQTNWLGIVYLKIIKGITQREKRIIATINKIAGPD